MAKIRYKPGTLDEDGQKIVDRINRIIEIYARQGYRLTLRQIYYRFIAGDYFPASWIDPVYNARNGLAGSTKNTEKNYKRLGSILNKARLYGMVDWAAVEDRTRTLRGLGFVRDPLDAVRIAMNGYRIDLWARQPLRIEVWVEKDALSAVVERVAGENRLNYFSCRGYNSQSEMWGAARRIGGLIKGGQTVTILHLGDHDPSGIDMTRDIRSRLKMFLGERFAKLEIVRIALNMRQVNKYNPPPNPAKAQDSRYRDYVEKFGRDCWELDALTPNQIHALIQNSIDRRRDAIQWAADRRAEDVQRTELRRVADNWERVVKLI